MSTAFQDNAFQTVELAFQIDVAVATPDGRGSWDAFRGKKRKKPKFIRRSDFETVEAYKKALASMFPVEPKTKIIEAPPPLGDNDDDELILAVVSRLIH